MMKLDLPFPQNFYETWAASWDTILVMLRKCHASYCSSNWAQSPPYPVTVLNCSQYFASIKLDTLTERGTIYGWARKYHIRFTLSPVLLLLTSGQCKDQSCVSNNPTQPPSLTHTQLGEECGIASTSLPETTENADKKATGMSIPNSRRNNHILRIADGWALQTGIM